MTRSNNNYRTALVAPTAGDSILCLDFLFLIKLVEKY